MDSPSPLDNDHVRRKCDEFLKELGIPGFIVFGFQKSEKQFGFVYTNHKTPPRVVVKGLSWALEDFSKKQL